MIQLNIKKIYLHFDWNKLFHVTIVWIVILWMWSVHFNDLFWIKQIFNLNSCLIFHGGEGRKYFGNRYNNDLKRHRRIAWFTALREIIYHKWIDVFQ